MHFLIKGLITSSCCVNERELIDSFRFLKKLSVGYIDALKEAQTLNTVACFCNINLVKEIMINVITNNKSIKSK